MRVAYRYVKTHIVVTFNTAPGTPGAVMSTQRPKDCTVGHWGNNVYHPAVVTRLSTTEAAILLRKMDKLTVQRRCQKMILGDKV
jgi:hypothetical protein